MDDLLDVTRIARGKIELRHHDLDLAAPARRTAEDYRPLMQARGLGLALVKGLVALHGGEVTAASDGPGRRPRPGRPPPHAEW